MRLPALALVPIVLILFSGCATDAPRVRPIQFSASTPTRLAASVADGRSAKLHSGNNFAYWLWRDTDGTWHLRSTASGKGHRFQGRIHADSPGALSIGALVSMEARGRHADDIGMVDGDIAFNLVTAEKEDGFDFRVARETCVEFELRIDGDGDPGKIFIGAKQTKPGSAHFLLCP